VALGDALDARRDPVPDKMCVHIGTSHFLALAFLRDDPDRHRIAGLEKGGRPDSNSAPSIKRSSAGPRSRCACPTTTRSKRREIWAKLVAAPPKVASRRRVSAESPAFFAAASNRLIASLAALLFSWRCSSIR